MYTSSLVFLAGTGKMMTLAESDINQKRKKDFIAMLVRLMARLYCFKMDCR